MLAFLLMVLGTSLGVLVSTTFFLNEESTWLTYYLGGVVGLLVSSVILEIKNIHRRKRELEEERKKLKIEF